MSSDMFLWTVRVSLSSLKNIILHPLSRVHTSRPHLAQKLEESDFRLSIIEIIKPSFNILLLLPAKSACLHFLF